MNHRLPFLALAAVACKPEDETTGEPPSVEILTPANGDTVPAGDVDLSVVVENFALVPPGTMARWDPTAWLVPSAWAHGDEEGAAGWLVVDLDGAEVLSLGETQGSVPGVAAGSHELMVHLIHQDGEELDPPVSASASFTAE